MTVWRRLDSPSIRVAVDRGICIRAVCRVDAGIEERQYDIAIMRALGASRTTVVAVLMVESLLLCGFGLALGLALAHGLAANIGAWLPAAAPLAAGASAFRAEEWAVAALALGVGIMATLIPAWRAYRLDVSATLAEG